MSEMEAKTRRNVSSLVGCIYRLPSSPIPSSSKAIPTLLATPYQHHSTDATLLGFACLVGDRGESLVPSRPVNAVLEQSERNAEFVVVYPSYNLQKSSLSFRVELGYFSPECEVCIMVPLSDIRTRCLDVWSQMIKKPLEVGDFVYCAYFSETDQLGVVIEGSVSISTPNVHELIAAFGLALSINAGIVTNSRGCVVGVHLRDFSLEDDEPAQSSMKSRNNLVIADQNDSCPIARQRSKDDIMANGHTTMPIGQRLREVFAANDSRGKRPMHQSMIFTLRQLRDSFLFFHRVQSLKLCLYTLRMYAIANSHNTYESWHQRRQLWHLDVGPIEMNGNSDFGETVDIVEI